MCFSAWQNKMCCLALRPKKIVNLKSNQNYGMVLEPLLFSASDFSLTLHCLPQQIDSLISHNHGLVSLYSFFSNFVLVVLFCFWFFFSGAWCRRFPAKFRGNHHDGCGGSARPRQEPNHVQQLRRQTSCGCAVHRMHGLSLP